jgi:hypothetical protein
MWSALAVVQLQRPLSAALSAWNQTETECIDSVWNCWLSLQFTVLIVIVIQVIIAVLVVAAVAAVAAAAAVAAVFTVITVLATAAVVVVVRFTVA